MSDTAKLKARIAGIREADRLADRLRRRAADIAVERGLLVEDEPAVYREMVDGLRLGLEAAMELSAIASEGVTA